MNVLVGVQKKMSSLFSVTDFLLILSFYYVWHRKCNLVMLGKPLSLLVKFKMTFSFGPSFPFKNMLSWIGTANTCQLEGKVWLLYLHLSVTILASLRVTYLFWSLSMSSIHSSLFSIQNGSFLDSDLFFSVLFTPMEEVSLWFPPLFCYAFSGLRERPNTTGEGSGGIDAHWLIVHSMVTRVTSSIWMVKRVFKEGFGFVVQADLF